VGLLLWPEGRGGGDCPRSTDLMVNVFGFVMMGNLKIVDKSWAGGDNLILIIKIRKNSGDKQWAHYGTDPSELLRAGVQV